jgi:predicted DNA-binding protein with PD1-like motif
MLSSPMVCGDSAIVILEPGEEVLETLASAIRNLGFDQAFLPVFLGAFRQVDFIGTTEDIPDPDAPLAASITVRNCEGSGSGTVTVGLDGPQIHLHASVGAKGDAARATAGHVLRAEVQYPTEVVITQIISPRLIRAENSAARGLRTLQIEGV